MFSVFTVNLTVSPFLLLRLETFRLSNYLPALLLSFIAPWHYVLACGLFGSSFEHTQRGESELHVSVVFVPLGRRPVAPDSVLTLRYIGAITQTPRQVAPRRSRTQHQLPTPDSASNIA